MGSLGLKAKVVNLFVLFSPRWCWVLQNRCFPRRQSACCLVAAARAEVVAGTETEEKRGKKIPHSAPSNPHLSEKCALDRLFHISKVKIFSDLKWSSFFDTLKCKLFIIFYYICRTKMCNSPTSSNTLI